MLSRNNPGPHLQENFPVVSIPAVTPGTVHFVRVGIASARGFYGAVPVSVPVSARSSDSKGEIARKRVYLMKEHAMR